MLILARQNLLHEPTRLIISVGGVALSVFLITLLLSLYRGWDEKVGGFVEDSEVDVWIASEGAYDFMTAASLLPLEGPDEELVVARYLGDDSRIASWSPMVVRQMGGRRISRSESGDAREGKRISLEFVGFDAATRLGAPTRIEEGAETPGSGEIIVDKVLSEQHGVGIGDTLRAGGVDWKVVGVSSGGDFVFWQTVFVTHDEAQRTLGITGQTTYYAVDLRDPTDAAAMVREVKGLAPGVTAFTRGEFTNNTRELVVGNLLPLILVVFSLAFVVGLSIAGLTIYTSTVEKAREYALLKAVGFRNGYLYRLVLIQSIVTSLMGFGAGFLLTLAFTPFARNVASQLVLYVRWQDALLILAATIVMGALAAYVPARRIANLDPTVVLGI